MASTFDLISIGSGSLRWIIILCVLVTLPAVALAAMFTFAATAGVTVTADTLRINCFPYSRTIARADLDTANARVVSRDDPALRRTVRLNGIGFAGIQVGWFHLQNGEKALVFLGDKDRQALYLPTTTGFALLLGAADPQALAAAAAPARAAS